MNDNKQIVAAEILQDNFTSDADRKEFARVIVSHGITFLHLANDPLPSPSAHDLGMIDRLAKSLSRLWPQALVIGGCHD